MSSLTERVARLHAAGAAFNENSRPDLAVRQLRAGLRLLDAGSASGRPPGALPADVDEAVAELRVRLMVSLAWAESERGRIGGAFRLLDEAEARAPAAQRPVVLSQRALLLERTGRNDLALAEFDAAVGLLSERTHPVELVKALNNRGILHLDEGHVRLARADLLRCVQLAGRHGQVRSAAIGRVNLGCLDVLAGDLPSALRAFGAARREYWTVAPGRLAGLAVELARALVAAGLFAEADRELAVAAEQAARQRLGFTYAEALQVRAEAALLAGRPEAAAEWAAQARVRFLGRNDARRAALASLLGLRAEYAAGASVAGRPGRPIATRAAVLASRLFRLGLPEDARVAGLLAARALVSSGRTRSAERIVTRYGSPAHVDRLDTRLLWRLTHAELAMAAGRPAMASRHLLAGIAALHRHRAQFGCLDLQTGAAVHGRDLARAGLRAALASGSVAAVYRWSERVRAQALLLPPVRPPDDPTAAAALEELRQVLHVLRETELAGLPAGRLRTRAEGLQRTVREHSWSACGRGGTGGPDMAAFAAAKDELADAALVAYIRNDAELWALVVAGGSAAIVRLGDYAVAAERVLRLRADLDTQAGRAMPRRLARAVAAATRADAGALAASILDPLLPRVGDRELVMVPTGSLVTVPWSVLPGCAGRPVTVAPSVTAWLAAAGRLRARPPHRGASTLLVAGPGNKRGDPEVRAIAALRPHATVMVGTEATPAATLAALARVTIAHLAAHGHHQSENALFSMLALAGGPLMGYDLQQLDHIPSMVVLSSCDLGLTDIRPGDEALGLATALLAAGSATVVASVSRVSDDAAMTVMARFHQAVVIGRSPAAALAAAMPPGQSTGFVCFGAG